MRQIKDKLIASQYELIKKYKDENKILLDAIKRLREETGINELPIKNGQLERAIYLIAGIILGFIIGKIAP